MEVHISKELKRFDHLIGEIDGLYHDAAVALGVPDSVMGVLYTVCAKGERCPLRDICRQSGMSKQTVNSALRKLEGEGMIYLEPSGPRSKDVCLTPAGRELAGRTAVPLMEVEDEIFSAWGAEEVERYLRLTQRYLEDFRQKSKRFYAKKEQSSAAPGG